MYKKIKVIFALFILVTISLLYNSCSSGDSILLPGKYNNVTLLPNGWRLTPAGEQVQIGELPLNLIITGDEKYALTSNNGVADNSISVVDLENMKETQRITLNKTWRGIAFNEDESMLYASGGNNNLVYVLNFSKGRLSLADSILIGKRYPEENISITGIDYVPGKNYLLAVSRESNSLYVIDVNRKNVIKKIKLSGKCFDVKVNHAGTYAYVSIWGKASVAEINLDNLEVSNIISSGDHPCDMAITRNDKWLFVTNANNNTTSVIDLRNKKEIEKLNSALSPDVPYGSTPDAVCLDSEDAKLYVANADNNYVAVFDVTDPGKSKSLGFIPTGWYPTAIKYLDKTDRIIVANGKGLSSRANLMGPNPEIRDPKTTVYIASMFKGTLSLINKPEEEELNKYSSQVFNNTPYIYRAKEKQSSQNVIPVKPNGTGSRQIKHVFYIIKENRTYDQVYGDLPQGNGDSSICLFGKKITPNQHKIATDYTLYDNFYADAEVSADGHNWSTAAYATDYVEKIWPVSYGWRGGSYDFEGGVPAAAPSSGYIWNNVMNHGKTFRNYGEFVDWKKDDDGNYIVRDEDLVPVTNRKYPPFDMKISDLDRYAVWEKDFEKFEKDGNLPNFNLIRLPNDHTSGTRKGAPTPQAYLAQNDYALGLIVDKISHSRFWNESIIFVVEDDAQNGSDHVDAHRSCLLVIGPYVKRHFVDHTMYSTSGVLKTMELILGLPPMTQFDLSATPILHSITDTPDFSKYDVIKPHIDVNEKNLASAYGSALSARFNLKVEDAIPDVEFNEIIWKAVKGKDSKMPAPVRSAFVKIHSKDNDDD